ncbi:amino acid adenylation domain-containing protein [Paenibacillus thiaminolyticus]|uniref:non-ribosomal peptide synthetase n=1 Tax=Paenibacillus thiaminolyticus TaxID=49283 RepID=UPI0035A6EE67
MTKSLLNLSLKQSALFNKWLEEESLHAGAGRIECRSPGQAEAPLSFGQQRLWFLSQLGSNAPYNMPLKVSIRGTLDKDRLLDSLQALVDRHESLRTTITAREDGELVQIIAERSQAELNLIDLQDLMNDSRKRQAIVDQMVHDDAVSPFDLERGPLLRVSLFTLSEQEHLLLINMHHIISDGWSLQVFLKELSTIYEKGVSALPELPVQYADYVIWQSERLTDEFLEQESNFWLNHLAGAPTVLQLPADRPRPPEQSYRGMNCSSVVESELSDRLLQLAREERVTPYMLFFAVFNVLLFRYTGQKEILIGTPIAGREQVETQNLIGLFAKTVVMRTDLAADPTFRSFLQSVKRTMLDTFSHQDLPFEKLVEMVKVDRDTSYHPIFQVWYSYQEQTLREFRTGDKVWSPQVVDNGTAKFDLALDVISSNEGIDLSVNYNKDLFDHQTVTRMVEHVKNLMQAAVARPDTRLSELNLLGDEERRQLLYEWNGRMRVPYPQHLCIHELFEAQVERTPDQIALIDGPARLTYRQLEQYANQMARRLQESGIGPEKRVGICLERNADLVIAMLGVLKAGGAYVPLDPHYPKERLQMIAEDAELTVLIAQERVLGVLPGLQAELIDIEKERVAIHSLSDQRPEDGAEPNHAAYLIYTSGSTGRPKGVEIEHRNAVNMLTWSAKEFPAEHLQGILVSTSICFDLSVYEMFLPLSVGGKAILAQNVLHLPTLPARDEVTLINTVPSAMTELLRNNEIPSSVRTVNLAGEPLRRALVDGLYAVGTIENVYNLYGPSETTTYSTFIRVNPSEEGAPTIGHAVGNTQLYVLDHKMQPVPINVPGELYIGGDGVSRGYFKRPELTGEKYLPDPFVKQAGARLYRTGDVVRYRRDGQLELLHRLDSQVKVRGFRIELGEVEATILQHPAVRETCVLVREADEDRRLVAYLVFEPGQHAAASDLRFHLRANLPDYMVPQAFVTVEKIPLLPNGKVDRTALLRTQGIQEERTSAYIAPETEAERNLCLVWQELLGVERVGMDDNFFELGGHSLLLMRMRLLIAERMGARISMTDLFRYPTVARMAKFLTMSGGGQDEQRAVRSEAQKRAKSRREARKQLMEQGMIWRGQIRE